MPDYSQCNVRGDSTGYDALQYSRLRYTDSDWSYGSMQGMGGRTLYAVDFQENSEVLREFLYGMK